MRTLDNIENFFFDLELPYERVHDDMWVVSPPEKIEKIVIFITGPSLSFRVKLFELNTSDKCQIFKKLLELNATEMVHGAYGLENNSIVIVDALEIENLDLNELRATIESIDLAISMHYSVLSTLLKS